MRGDGLLLHIFSNAISSKDVFGIALSWGGARDQTMEKERGKKTDYLNNASWKKTDLGTVWNIRRLKKKGRRTGGTTV